MSSTTLNPPTSARTLVRESDLDQQRLSGPDPGPQSRAGRGAALRTGLRAGGRDSDSARLARHPRDADRRNGGGYPSPSEEAAALDAAPLPTIEFKHAVDTRVLRVQHRSQTAFMARRRPQALDAKTTVVGTLQKLARLRRVSGDPERKRFALGLLDSQQLGRDLYEFRQWRVSAVIRIASGPTNLSNAVAIAVLENSGQPGRPPGLTKGEQQPLPSRQDVVENFAAHQTVSPFQRIICDV